MEDSSGVAILVPHSRGQQESVFIPERVETPPGTLMEPRDDDQGQQQKQTADSLIEVIEKLSKIVEKRPRRFTLAGKKRALMSCASVRVPEIREGSGGSSPCKRARELEEEVKDQKIQPDNSAPAGSSRTITCYQCSLCRFLSPTLSLLKEHLRQHDEQHSDLILMCSECRFTSSHQEELEAHVRLHFDCSNSNKNPVSSQQASEGNEGLGMGGSVEEAVFKTAMDCAEDTPAKKKWYSYEEYGMYRCLICSYVCGQQRMLKTHAWKHAGLVDCSYPIFEDEAVAPAPPVVPPAEEAIVVLAPVPEKSQNLNKMSTFQINLCAPVAECGNDAVTEPITEESPVEGPYPSKDPVTEEPILEVQVTTETEVEPMQDCCHITSTTDSLLSSAQKIISCSPNSADHVNVIVERLPCAEEPVATQPLPILPSPEVGRDKSLLAAEEAGHVENQPMFVDKDGQQEVVIGWSNSERQQTTTDTPRDENAPPARRRTHSESLRLHSLAAEALVTMPMRTAEHIRSIVGQDPQSPDTGQWLLEMATAAAVAADRAPAAVEELTGMGNVGAALVDLELQGSREDGLAEGPAKVGISLSLLTVIERLKERSDQNATDEDILKELQDNAQSQHAGEVSACGGGDPGNPGGGLVDYIPGSERPYHCRLCRYSSGNKGYIKQHLRVHRQRQPYQCPICEHIALDSKDLESHMINHCKTRMYHCKECTEAFYYKSQLRNHETDQHGLGDTGATLSPVTETTATAEGSVKMTDDDSISSQKVYKCDVCDYTSSTYVGVRNHRRIHNSDKPYRCCSCDFATTNMNSLKSHMRRHPQEHQAVQLLEQYRCSLCGYVCSHPPSLKSHMWKHAGDQNYNYEQVNKAINEAISQSGRSPSAPQKVPAVGEAVAEQSGVVQGGKEDPAPLAGIPVDSVGAGSGASTELIQWSSREPAPQSETPQHSPLGMEGVQSRAGMEYCVLLFCCCICGFESTSKERLMEHMKEHEGDIISIILNKEQQQGAAQPAEGSTAQ
ncbi:zinc finger protein 507 [Oncorhynchus tshawytscha]|uniref:C2H2-type domain-containing protein n=1 Tax=Oncorhynchus tshawytscha TaxID=74940 RepID=A0A8C8FHZ5_ONCTS|nr:zinc finger protein 507 [Oncorhynchus tshawytscha]